ncbi:MAG TPA: hypothetical protein VGH98_13380 [Gemmatimonadaceae bacterium]|jgi:hypothetical protein
MSNHEDTVAERESTDGRIERAKDVALGPHHGQASLGDEIGEATGGIAGVLLGAGIGSSAGPVGTLLGGIAGAIGGWWTGRAISEAAEKLSAEDDEQFRAHYESSDSRLSDRSYDDVRGAYFLGHIASSNPNFVDRTFSEVEPELARGWRDCADRPCEWEQVRSFVGEGYRRGVERRQHTERRTTERADELERRLAERRDEDTGEVH